MGLFEAVEEGNFFKINKILKDKSEPVTEEIVLCSINNKKNSLVCVRLIELCPFVAGITACLLAAIKKNNHAAFLAILEKSTEVSPDNSSGEAEYEMKEARAVYTDWLINPYITNVNRFQRVSEVFYAATQEMDAKGLITLAALVALIEAQTFGIKDVIGKMGLQNIKNRVAPLTRETLQQKQYPINQAKILDDIFSDLLLHRIPLDSVPLSPQRHAFFDALQTVNDITLENFNAKKEGFSFDDCMSIANSVKRLSSKVSESLQQKDVDAFTQAIQPYITCSRMKAALVGLIGAALGLVTGFTFGGVPGAAIGAVVGFGLFGGGYARRHQRNHPLTQLAEAAKTMIGTP